MLSSTQQPYHTHPFNFTPIQHPSTTPLPSSSHHHQSIFTAPVPVPTCLDTSSVFFRVLTAQFQPPPPRPPPPPQIPIDEAHAEKCRSMVDWNRRPITPESPDSSDEEDVVTPAVAAHFANLRRAIYKPHGKWAWADGLPIENSDILQRLGSGRMCSATIKHGTLGGRPLTYVSKSWKTAAQAMWHGFHSELALYKSEQYLKPLQGTVVPSVIGVHVLPGEICVSMEPPHHSFWLEASPDMPDVLKERCIAAFEQIHSRKVLHGDIELRHMLIGGDGKVTIIDFQGSRSLIPNEAVKLRKAEPHEFQLEMRKVKFKLNYDNAREKERTMRFDDDDRKARNKEKHQRTALGAHVSPFEDDPPEYSLEPPVHKQDWNDSWVIASDAEPNRFVMPGKSTEDLERDIRSFLAVIARMQSEKIASASADDASRSLSSPPPSPPNSSVNLGNNTTLPPTEPDGNVNPPEGAPSDHTTLFIPTSLSNQPADTSKPRHPPIKVRDFAYEPYNGPRGYKVPHKATEDKVKLEMIYRLARAQARAWLTRRPPIPPMTQADGTIQMGVANQPPVVPRPNLKRGRDPAEGPGVPFPERKKKRNGAAPKTTAEASCSRKRKREDSDTPLAGPSRSTENPADDGDASSNRIQPIPRKPLPPKKVVHHRPRWHKLRPSKDLRVTTLKKVAKSRQAALDADGRGSQGFGTHHLHGSGNRYGEHLALATLGMMPPTTKDRGPRTIIPQLQVPKRKSASTSGARHGEIVFSTRPRKKTRYNSAPAPIIDLRSPSPPTASYAIADEDEVENILQAEGPVLEEARSSRRNSWLGFWRFFFW